MKLRLPNPFNHRPTLVRTPLPGFDPFYYLYWYPDVRAPSVDPLHHYLRHGWKEGRDPSAGFSTAGYLAANPDVAMSGDNPLLHFINLGFAEGRKGFEKDPEAPAPKPGLQDAPPKLLPPPRTTDRMPAQGYIDFVDHTEVHGWAISPDSSERPAEVHVIVNQALVGRVIADLFRPDLQEEGIGNAHHAFTFTFDPPLNKKTTHTVIFLRSVDQVEIGRAVLQANQSALAR